MTAGSRSLAVITGASAGIGEMFARKLAARGYDLLLIARRGDRLQALGSELAAAHRISAETSVADLASDAGMRAVEARLAASDALALLVNNAGFGIGGRFFDTDIEEHDRMHRLHVIATLRLTHAALRRMVPSDRGAIINVSSVAGFAVSPGSVTYNATKHWINSFTEGVSLDLRTRGSQVQIQALCPGFTYTEFHDVMRMERKAIPAAWWMPAEAVVEASLDGLTRGKLFVIPGWRYKLTVLLLKLLPSRMRNAGSIWYARRFRRPATPLPESDLPAG